MMEHCSSNSETIPTNTQTELKTSPRISEHFFLAAKNDIFTDTSTECMLDHPLLR